MTALRSFAFNILFFGLTTILSLLYLPFLLLPRKAMVAGARVWVRLMLFFLKWVAGLSHEFRGLERLPPGPFLIAAKHQSAWDTLIFHILLPDPAFILKKELLNIPLFGWYLAHHGMIAIDRSAGASALKKMLKEAQNALARGSVPIVFPEGTRTAPGDSMPYHPGIAALYADLKVPVVPVALNSGLYWRRKGFMKRPGRIVLEVLDPIEPGMDRRQFLATLKERIETACQRLGEAG
ncbi:1-acyl-sn-glycerol-3-phosphate acyltransferase [Rhodospirillaceae bacterium LM-1]|nr:1-acyl-sn-glycerol-3-phosphate acyltransferase [Rhodospirillaceae bacterium LM-1]